MKPNSNFRNHGLTKDLNYFSTAIDLYEYSKIIPLGILKKCLLTFLSFYREGKVMKSVLTSQHGLCTSCYAEKAKGSVDPNKMFFHHSALVRQPVLVLCSFCNKGKFSFEAVSFWGIR